jgi:FtsP/CotA-like multicopper oxidase with cupredoxin domain
MYTLRDFKELLDSRLRRVHPHGREVPRHWKHSQGMFEHPAAAAAAAVVVVVVVVVTVSILTNSQVNLEVSKMRLSPDGVPRDMMVFNGQYPGPTIVADWGDTIQVTVTNNLPDNGTSVHWHGVRQLHSNQMDGVNGLTECPIAPGQTKVYTFKATAHGTSWYHSHYSVQYGDGMIGPIVINGPSSANYDIDMGTVSLTDWYHMPMFELLASMPTVPPTSQTILVNGQQTPKFKFTPGKKHLLRFINTGINQFFHFGIDGHRMQVIRTDFVAVQPYYVDSLSIAVGKFLAIRNPSDENRCSDMNLGQRYEVIVEANQAPGNYYLRVGTGGGRCDGPNEQALAGNTKGALITYDGTPAGEPTVAPLVLPSGCTDEETGIIPFVTTTVPAPGNALTGLHLTLDTSAGVFWKVNNQAMDIDWSTPTLDYVLKGNYTLPPNDNAITINQAGWVYFLITNDTPLPHPVHLHGHDYFVLATGNGTGADAQLKFNNPIRRDTHSVAGNNGTPGAGGYMVIAYMADNPGAWLMHCHIPFHISGGLGVQFLERPAEIIGTLGDLTGYANGCSTWNNFQLGINRIPQPDSGLKKRRMVRY